MFFTRSPDYGVWATQFGKRKSTVCIKEKYILFGERQRGILRETADNNEEVILMTWIEGFHTFVRNLKLERMQTVCKNIYKVSKIEYYIRVFGENEFLLSFHLFSTAFIKI